MFYFEIEMYVHIVRVFLSMTFTHETESVRTCVVYAFAVSVTDAFVAPINVRRLLMFKRSTWMSLLVIFRQENKRRGTVCKLMYFVYASLCYR